MSPGSSRVIDRFRRNGRGFGTVATTSDSREAILGEAIKTNRPLEPVARFGLLARGIDLFPVILRHV